MKKLALISLMLGLMMLVSVIGMVSAVIPTLFSDGFESGNFNSWSQHDNDWYITTSGEHSGTYAALTCDSENDVLRKAISTSGYENIVFSYWYKISESLGSDDHVYAEWYDGSSWHEVAHYTNVNSGSWTQATFNLPSGAKNNPNFQIRFRSVNLENCCEDALKLDDILVTGKVIFEEPTPYCGDGILDSGEECDDGNTQNGDGCSSTCQIEEECTLTIDEPDAGDWFDSQAVPIEWHLEGDCQSVVYFHLYYHKSLDGRCNTQGPWYPIITNLASGDAGNPSFPNYHYETWKPSESGQYCVYVEVHSAGKKGYSGIFNVDLAKPVVHLSVGTPKVGECLEGETGNCYVNQDTKMTLSCTDDNPQAPWQSEGPYTIKYKINSGSEVVYETPFSFEQDSQHSLEYWCYDEVGKESPHKTKNFIVESVAPVTTKEIIGPQYESGGKTYLDGVTTIKLTCVDPEPHPVNDVKIYYKYTVDGQLVQNWVLYTQPFSFPEESKHELEYYCKDTLGNEEAHKFEIDYVDHTKPVTTKTYIGPQYPNPITKQTPYPRWINSQTQISLSAVDTDTTGHGCNSGVKETKYRVTQVDDRYCMTEASGCSNAVGFGDFLTYTAPFAIGESCHLIEYYSVDNVDKTEVTKKQCVFSDHTAPTLDKEVGEPSEKCGLFNDCGDPIWNWYENPGIELDYEVTLDTEITMSCQDQEPHPSGVGDNKDSGIYYRVVLDGKYNEASWQFVPADEFEYQFPEQSEHLLEFYCVDNVGKISDTDSELFKVTGTEFTLEIGDKWDLISVPFQLIGDGDVEDVFDNSDVVEVWSYEDGVWKVYSPSDGLFNLDKIVPGRGYWVKTTDGTTILIGGSLMEPASVPPSIELDKGWNLIGHYDLSSRKAYCSLFSLVDTQQGFPRWSALWRYNSASQTFIPLTQWDNTNPGRGYWLEMDVEDSYSPSSICYGFS